MTPAAHSPGQQRLPSISALIAFQRDPIGFLSAMAERHGDVVRFQLGPQPTVLLNAPDDIREILVGNARNFVKSRVMERTKRLLGEGLLTSEGAFHLRQRRLAAPAFHRQRVAAYGAAMARLADEHQTHWQPGQTVDFNQEMMRLTLRIAGETLFGAETDQAADAVYSAMHDLLDVFVLAPLPFIDIIEQLPLPAMRRFQAARARLDAVVYSMIDARRKSGEDRGDLLSMLLAARDAEGDGTGMTDAQIRDEVLTIFLAGHETTANALTWTFYLLAQYPARAEQLHGELDRVLGDRAPTVADLPRLTYVEQVFAEAMRLYPPAWIMGRRALGPFTVAGQPFPAGTAVIMSQWVVHHDPRHYPAPYTFDPTRFTPEARAARPKFAYFPFGGGPRTCIGEQFAWMEGVLGVAAIARNWQPALLAGHPVVLQPSITLRPRYGVRMRLWPRLNMV